MNSPDVYGNSFFRSLRDGTFLLSLAFKNLTRHKRRTVITASSLAMGLMIYLLLNSLLTGIEVEGVRNLIWYETGAAQIQNSAYWDDRLFLPMDKDISSPGEIMNRLELAGFKTAQRTQFGGELIVSKDPYPESGFSRAIFTAVDPTKDADVYRIHETLVEGRWLKPGEEGVVLGNAMADQLGAHIGFPVTIKTRTRDGVWQTMDFPILGIFRSPNALVNRMHVYLDRSVADDYLYLGDSATFISVQRGDWEDVGSFEKALQAVIGPGLTVLTWKTLGSDFLGFIQSRSNITFIILFLVFIIAAVGVSNTMLLTILERTRELGMLRAQGMHDKEIFLGLLMEAGAIGFIGGVTGLVMGSLINIPLTTTGLDASGLLTQINASLPFSGVIRGAWNLKSYFIVFVAGIVISILVSIIPIRHALKQEITEALRHN